MITILLTHNTNKIKNFANSTNKHHTMNYSFINKLWLLLFKVVNKKDYLKFIDKCNTIEINKSFSELTPKQIDRYNIIVEYSRHENSFRDEKIRNKLITKNKDKNLIINIPLISDLRQSDFKSKVDLILLDEDIPMAFMHAKRLLAEFYGTKIKLF